MNAKNKISRKERKERSSPIGEDLIPQPHILFIFEERKKPILLLSFSLSLLL